MSTLIERIQEVMNSQGWDIQQTANVAGVSRSAVAQWLGQGNKIIHSIGRIDAAEKLAAVSGYNALWIARGEGEKKSSHGPMPAWPFSDVDQKKIQELNEKDLVRIEVAMLMAAAQFDLDIKKT